MPQVRYAFTFEFDRRFVQRALRRDRNWALVKVVAIYALATAIVLPTFEMHRTLSLALLAGGFIATIALVVVLFARVARSTYSIWERQCPSRKIRYELDDEGFQIHMDHASSRFAWQGIRRLWRYDDVWLIEIVRKQSAFFPPESASDAARIFIAERCKSGGARV